MKNSGIEWIGEIPDDWNITTIKYACVFSPKCSKIVGLGIENEITYTPMEYIKNGYYIQNTKIIADIPSSLTMYEEGDIVMAKVTPCFENGNIARMDNLVNGVGVGSSELYVFRTKKYNRDYLFYLLQNYIFKDCAASTMIGTGGLKRVSSHFIKNSKQPFPPISEQKAIAEFLDKKCGEVDALIADIQQEIETLEQYKRSVITEAVTKGLDPSVPMKDSGAGWMPTVPAHWLVEKIKYHLHLKTQKNMSDRQVLSLYRDYGIVPKDSRDDNHNVTSEDTSSYRFVRVGDFVVNKMKAWQGSVAVSQYEGIVSPAYFVYEFIDESFDKKYFHYLLRNKSYTIEFMRLSGGIRVGQWDLPAEAFENTLVLIPPIEEQQQIADYLDKKCKEIEEIIADKQSQIETLESYKKSLIYECVTGKKEVG